MSAFTNRFFIGVSIFSVIAVCLYPFILVYNTPDFDWAVRGQIGDSFAILTSIFSMISFIAVLYTISLQQKQLELQGEELKLTREQLTRSGKAQEESEKALAKQVELMTLSGMLEGYGSYVEFLNQDIHNYLNSPKGYPLEEQEEREYITKKGMRLSYLGKMELILEKLDKIREANSN